MKRRPWDFYPTPAWATEALLRSVPEIGGPILEPCSGAGDITRILITAGHQVATNDLNPRTDADTHEDAAIASLRGHDWIVSNPPFNQAPAIVANAVRHARVGVAMLLRLSFLEPCDNRARWLESHPPDRLLILPRISFTGDGNTDSVTCGWMVWAKIPLSGLPIQTIPRSPSGVEVALF